MRDTVKMKVSKIALIAIAYACSSSALPIANGASGNIKRQTSEIIVPITHGTAFAGHDISSDNVPTSTTPPAPSSTPIIIPIVSPSASLPSDFGGTINSSEPSKPGGIPPGVRSPLAFKLGRKGTQGQQLKEEVLTDPFVKLSDEKRKFLEKVPDTIWDQITLQAPGTFEKQLDDLVFESKTPNALVPLLAARNSGDFPFRGVDMVWSDTKECSVYPLDAI
ncbi:hypothetical protein TWF718_001846 [Orbilia javanica]|uniref:Uncharacterized protein n=1 Tax=Orbilia javanica TaxID=47235 RepID=A0AAN8RNL3_9PEZI